MQNVSKIGYCPITILRLTNGGWNFQIFSKKENFQQFVERWSTCNDNGLIREIRSIPQLFTHFRRTIWLTWRMSCTKCGMVFQFPIYSQCNWKRTKVHLKSKRESSGIIKMILRMTMKKFSSYRRALKTWGTRQQSAKVISSPTQYFPAEEDNNFSTAKLEKISLLIVNLTEWIEQITKRWVSEAKQFHSYGQCIYSKWKFKSKTKQINQSELDFKCYPDRKKKLIKNYATAQRLNSSAWSFDKMFSEWLCKHKYSYSSDVWFQVSTKAIKYKISRCYMMMIIPKIWISYQFLEISKHVQSAESPGVRKMSRKWFFQTRFWKLEKLSIL